MDYIEEYFKEKAKNVNFIELKEYAKLSLGVEDDSLDVPLPLVSDVLAEGISSGDMKEKVDVEMILDGMIYIIGTDRNFELYDDYINILKGYSEKIEDYIFFKGIQFLDQELIERSEVYFRALRYINPNHLLGRFNYGLALERIAQKFINEDKGIKADAFIKESTSEFESVLDIDEEYPLAYYKLGYHYNFANQHLKAKLMWEKYINLDDDELRIQEVREQIALIEDEVILESALTYLSYNRHEEALDYLLKLLPRHEKWWELRYLIGSTYAGLDEGDKAIDEYYTALELNDEIEDVYNELGIELFKRGDLDEAVSVYTDGLSKLSNSYKLYFNRGLAFIQLSQYDRAYEDVNKAYELNPIDENVREMKEYLDQSLKS